MVIPKTSGILPEPTAPLRPHGKPPSWRHWEGRAPSRPHGEPPSWRRQFGEAALSPLRLVGPARRAGRCGRPGEPHPLLHLHHHLEEPHRRLLRRRRPFTFHSPSSDSAPFSTACISAPVQRFTFGSHSTFSLPSSNSMDTIRQSFTWRIAASFYVNDSQKIH